MTSAPGLQYEFTLHVALEPNIVAGAGPYGTRMVAPVAGGTVSGERLNGTIQLPGADWVLIGNDGFGRLDVRLQVQTDDGAVVYVSYGGLLELNAAARAAIADPTVETGWDEQYFRVDPRFETGAKQYAWLQQSLFVGRGRIATDGVEYEVYRVE